MNKIKCFGAIVAVTYVTVSANTALAAQPPGPLKVHQTNPRYFDDGTGKAVYLAGSHVWGNLQADISTNPSHNIDYTYYLNLIDGLNHNFIRGWHWEDAYYTPLPFARTGPGTANDGQPKFDLDQYNPDFFTHIRNRAIEAGNRGMYIGIMLFEGWSIENKGGGRTPNPWPWHPFNSANNINGINGDPNGDGQGKEVHTLAIPAVTAKQDAYVRHYIDQLNDLDNIIWEISNESHSGSWQWQYHMIDLIHSYEATKPKQHLVWMNCYGEDFPDSYLFNGPADVVSPHRFDTNYRLPPASTGNKIVVLDTDHLWGVGGNKAWVWMSFTRGYHPIFMDPLHNISWYSKTWNPNDPTYVAIRTALGRTRVYAEKMDLAEATPQNALSSTGYCLADPGMEYLVYQPTSGASFSINLASGSYNYEWYNTSTGTVAQTGNFSWAGGNKSFTAPFSGDSVIYLTENEAPVAMINANPTTGSSPLTVHFDASASYDKSGGTIVSYDWDFYGDGTQMGTGQNASFTYRTSRPQTFVATLTVTDDDAYTDTVTVAITANPGNVGDFDGDNDVDQEDFGHFQDCMTGNGNDQSDWNCLDTLLDDDDDVDLNDYTIFQGCMSGPNIPLDQGCAN